MRAALILACLLCPGLSAAERPNIVLLMADDQGWGDVGFRNPELHTPVLDELAQTGLHFTRFYAAAPVCSPTRGSVMTGRHPNRFGCFSWGHTLRPQEVTVAEALRGAGYTTGHFGKWHLGSVRADSNASPGASGFDEWFSCPNFYDNDPLMSHRGRVIRVPGESSIATAELAIRWMTQAAAGEQPFLAVIWFGSPHGPHIAAPKYRDMYPNLQKNKQNFYGEVTAMDEAVGNVRTALKKLGIADNTLLWYTSDNGALPVGSAGGLSGRKGKLLEGGIRVPAMIEWPAKISAPRTVETPWNTVDIYPTLLEIAGAAVANQPVLDGVSMLPLIQQRETSRGRPMGFWVRPASGVRTASHELMLQLQKEQSGEQPAGPASPDTSVIARQYPEDRFPGDAAWIDGNLKLLRRAQRNGEFADAVFDLSADPAEQHDLSETDSERTARMRTELLQWQRSVTRSLNGKDYKDVAAGAAAGR